MQRLSLLLLHVLVLAPAGLAAQDPGPPSIAVAVGQPRFLSGIAPDAKRVEPASVPALRRSITLTAQETTLGAALDAITRQTGIRFLLSSDVISLDKSVRVEATRLSLAAALTELLLDARVDVAVVSETELALVRRGPLQPGTLEGTVMGFRSEGEPPEPVASAQVEVEGTGLGTLTDNEGRFRIAGVPVGRQSVTVSSIGWRSTTQEVDVAEGEIVTVAFTLEVSPTTLNELVVTATGQQRRLELGHVVGRINADSVIRETPVSSLSELLTARVPGLHVFTHSGLVGGSASLQARTPNSIFLSSEPILIVDGVRYGNTYNFPGNSDETGAFTVEETSRLNDLNPNDIESIEVVKGPSAAALYGTDAANGVILITTKRGQAGEARWDAYIRSTLNEIPRHQYPDLYWGWGTVFGIPDSRSFSCTLLHLDSGLCTQQDSVTALPNPLDDPELTVFHSKPGWEYGGSLSGGGQDMRYFFSAALAQATGPVQMPAATIERLLAERGLMGLPDEQLEPNAQRQLTLRGNVTLGLGSTAELQLNSGFAHNGVRTGQSSYATFQTGTPDFPHGEFRDPGSVLSRTSTESTDRVFGSIVGRWSPQTWLQGRGTLGLDLGNSDRSSLALPGESALSSTGLAEEVRTRRLVITGDVGLSAHARLGRLSFRTAVGAQYTRQKTNQLASTGSGLPPGGESVAQAANKSARQSYAETATLGSYVEETIGLNDRLFLSGALRVDGASNFGRNYKAAVYPKASVSWLVSEEPFMPRVPGLDELRLRYAFGASGQQPTSFMTLPSFSISDALVDSVPTTAIAGGSIGNPDLRPERVREHEAGLDVTALAGRLQLGLTWFDRTTTDQLVSRPASLGFGSIFRNLGRVSAHGFEADLTLRPIETRPVTWQITLQHTFRRTVVEDLGGLTENRSRSGGYVEGYPLGARFSTEILGWDDANGDGILVPAELQMGTEPTYQGESTPPRTQTLMTSLGLFQQRVRLSALLQRLSGYTQISVSCGQRCRAAVDPSTPLEQQAVVVAPSAPVPYANIEPADHTRLQEVTVAVDLPEALLRGLRLRTGTVTLSGRNLALWTSFSGPDPASARVSNFSGGTAGNIPHSRTWVVRLDIGL